MFGEKLRQRRENIGLSQADLALQIGLSAEVVRDLETGAIEPSPEIVHKLAGALGMPWSDLDAALADNQQAALSGSAVSVSYEKP